MSDRIYLDYNATTPIAPEVADAMRPYLEGAFGNPSSQHWSGTKARDAVESARSQVASLLCCDATEVVFTSGGTEANNLAIKGVFWSALKKQPNPHFIVSGIEHPAVLEPCEFLTRFGATLTILSVDRYGLVDPDEVRRAIRNETVLVSVMHANNEVGTIQPIEEIAGIARERGVLSHTDAAQSAGKISVDCDSLGVDLLTVAGHKLYAPKGVGALFIREGVALEPLLHGADHEAGRRAGTENVLEIVGLGAACSFASQWVESDAIPQLRNHLWKRFSEEFGSQVQLNGHPTQRLPNTVNLSFRNLFGGDILAHVPDIAASTGAACHAGQAHMSSVLAAMGVEELMALGAIRLSLGRETTLDEVNRAANQIIAVVQQRMTK